MKEDFEKRNCKKHGYTLFKLKKAKDKSWYSCQECLKFQWKKAQDKQRKKPDNKSYHQEYNKKAYQIRKSLSIYLTMILLAANICPSSSVGRAPDL